MKLCLLLVVLYGVCRTGYAQNISTFDYRIKRGTLIWDTLKNYEVRRDLCQIPNNVIGNMTTLELLNSVLDYPLLADAFIFNNYQEGVDKIVTTFYALDSLLKRQDIKSVCISVYNNYHPNEINSYKEILGMATFMFKMNFLELLIAQKEIYSDFTIDEKNTILSLLVKNYYDKKMLLDKFDNWGLSTIGWASCRICNIDVILKNNTPSGKKYIDSGYTINIEALDEIMIRATTQIKL
ncbi:MAG: hypothetical protein IT250_10505 [Chitinophagaceae bacterium]|nr:hypothetical protein [Chitinophagaceae bacterium]